MTEICLYYCWSNSSTDSDGIEWHFISGLGIDIKIATRNQDGQGYKVEEMKMRLKPESDAGKVRATSMIF